MNKPVEYLCQVDSGILPTIDTLWSITDPNLVVWGLTISTAGVITVTSGVVAGNTPYMMGLDGTRWSVFIDIDGIVSIQGAGVPLATSDAVAALTDSNSVEWVFVVGLDGLVRITTETPLENKFYYPAILIAFATSASTDQFELHAIKPNTTMHRR